MLRRFVLGLLKGALLGGAIGAAFHWGLGWTQGEGLLLYLVAMGAGATSGVLVGKPPWQQDAWIESVLKAVAGLGFGALLYWITSTWAGFGVPFALPGVNAGTPWTQIPLVVSTIVSLLFGILVELDHTGGGADTPRAPRKQAAPPKARAAALVVDVEDAELVRPPRERGR
ncbi:MAG: hypothetical protein KF901_10780 [Myxococcales bacterium]|nr:hypothetical protein [Myxococcales bacterium]